MFIISSVFIMVPPLDDLLGSIDIMEPIKLESGISSKLLIYWYLFFLPKDNFRILLLTKYFCDLQQKFETFRLWAMRKIEIDLVSDVGRTNFSAYLLH